jgi:hypothetical protein
MTTNSAFLRTVRENLLWSLEDFSDFERSKKEWRGENPSVRRSYDEDVALFFQTYQAEKFAREACNELGFNELQCAQFRRFVDLLSKYDRHVRKDKTVDSESVIGDPNWQEIIAVAAQTLRLLRKDDV